MSVDSSTIDKGNPRSKWVKVRGFENFWKVGLRFLQMFYFLRLFLDYPTKILKKFDLFTPIYSKVRGSGNFLIHF